MKPVSVVRRWLCLFVVSLAALPPALAEDKAPGLRLSLGAFQAKGDTTLRLDANNSNRGTTIDFENALGLEKERDVGWLDARWRFNPRHSLSLGYFGLNREGTRDLSTQVRFGEQTFDAGAQVNSRIDLGVAALTYTYSFISDGRNELGVTLGLHTTRVKARLSTPSGAQTEEAKATAPLPTIGLMGTLGFTERARLRAWAQFFDLKYDDYDGRMVNWAATLEYDFFKNFGVGVGWFDYALKLDTTKTRFTGNLDVNVKGPVAYVNFLF